MRASVTCVLFSIAIAPAGVGAESIAPAEIYVTDVAELRTAMQQATADMDIVIAAGVYAIDTPLDTNNSGPITVRGEPGVVIESSAVEAIRVTQPYWRFEEIEIRGTCADDSTCEHAFHISGHADSTRIERCTLVDFNAQIKSNGDTVGPSGTRVWPDDVVIVGNRFFDTRPRQTANPVTKLDVVGGRRWLVHANHISDFEKAQGDTISYAAFLKGNSRDGRFEANLVECARDFTGGTRVGLSFGGGGSGPDPICEDATCTPEHQNGTIVNNIIRSCSDVGIYLNESTNTTITHNTIYDTTGVDVRFPESAAALRGNLIGGAVRDRDGGSHTSTSDLVGVTQWAMWFVDPDASDFGLVDGTAFVDMAAVTPGVGTDFCGKIRDDGAYDIGALEYPLACDTTTTHPGSGGPLPPPGMDAWGAFADAANPGAEGGGGCGCRSADPTGSIAIVLLAMLGLARRRTES